jgi:hypothetical protein
MKNRTLQRATLLLLSLVVLTFTACKKQKAHSALIGDWKVTAFKGVLVDDCSGEGAYFDEQGDYGSVTFDNKLLQRNYTLFEDTAACFTYESINALSEWKVIDHSKELFIAHRYIVDIDGESWNILFGDEGVGEEAGDQALVYLSFLGSNGNGFSLELTRVPE